jgi:hypothetical protein
MNDDNDDDEMITIMTIMTTMTIMTMATMTTTTIIPMTMTINSKRKSETFKTRNHTKRTVHKVQG